jgi:hypothetical protein
VRLGVGELGDVQRVKTVDILLGNDAIKNLLLIEVAREWELHQDAVDAGICVRSRGRIANDEL